jgi:hypothetical protein
LRHNINTKELVAKTKLPAAPLRHDATENYLQRKDELRLNGTG